MDINLTFLVAFIVIVLFCMATIIFSHNKPARRNYRVTAVVMLFISAYGVSHFNTLYQERKYINDLNVNQCEVKSLLDGEVVCSPGGGL